LKRRWWSKKTTPRSTIKNEERNMTATVVATEKTFNFKKMFGKDVNPSHKGGDRRCPQCDGVGIEDGVRLAGCRKCFGTGLMKLAQADVPENDLAPADPTPTEETPEAALPSSSDEFRVDYVAGPDDVVQPPAPELPPEQMRKAVAAMLSGSFKHTIAAVFGHVATMNKMPEVNQAEHTPDAMLDYLYAQLERMDINGLRSAFEVLRKNE